MSQSPKPPQNLFNRTKKFVQSLLSDYLKDKLKGVLDFCLHLIRFKITLLLCSAVTSMFFPRPIAEGTVPVNLQKPNPLVKSAHIENRIFYDGYSVENGQYCRKTISAYQYWLPIYSDKKYDIFKEKFGSKIQVSDPGMVNPAHAIYFLMQNNKSIVRFTIPMLNLGRSSQLVQFEYLYQYPNGNEIWLPQNSQVLKKPIDLSKDTDITMSAIKINDTDIQVEASVSYFDLTNGSQQFQTFTSETILNIIPRYSGSNFTFGIGTLKGQCIDVKEGFNS